MLLLDGELGLDASQSETQVAVTITESYFLR